MAETYPVVRADGRVVRATVPGSEGAPAPHDPTPLEVLGRFTRTGGRSLGGRRWAVWYRRLRCPVCGREFVRLQNPDTGRLLRCAGRGRLEVELKP